MKTRKMLSLILALSIALSCLPFASAVELAQQPQEEIQTSEEQTAEDSPEESIPEKSDVDETETLRDDEPLPEEDEPVSSESEEVSPDTEETSVLLDEAEPETSPSCPAADSSEEEQLEPEEPCTEATQSEEEPCTGSAQGEADAVSELQADEPSALEPATTLETTELLDFIMQHGCYYEDETAYPWAYNSPRPYNSAEFLSWVKEQPEAQLTLSQWIQQNHAGWLTTSDMTLANHLLLEGILLYKWKQETGSPYYIPGLWETMDKTTLAEHVANLVSIIPERQSSDSDGDYSFNCIMEAKTVVAMLHALNIKGRVRYDASYNIKYASYFKRINHHDVLCYTERDDEPYLINCGGLDKHIELYDYVVLDEEKKTCAVVGFNGLDAKHLVIPSQIRGYTVTEVKRTLTCSLYEKDGCVEPEIITFPQTVTSIDADTFTIGATAKIWAVTGMSGISELKKPWSWVQYPSNVIRVLNFFDQSTTSSMVNVIPARFANNNWSSFQNTNDFIVPYIPVIKFEEGISTLGGAAYGYNYDWDFVDGPQDKIPSTQELYLPESLRTILPGFAGRAIQNLKVYIPSGVTSIGANSFTKNTVFFAEASNTVAKNYAKANGIPFIPVKNVRTDKANYTRTWDIDLDLSVTQLSVSQASLSYTGKSLKPDVTVSICGKPLEKLIGTNAYTLSYTNNVNAGTATVTAKGKAPCKGSVSATFQINKAKQKLSSDQTSYDVELGEPTKIPIHNAFGKIHYSVDYSSFIGFTNEELKEAMSVTDDGVVTLHNYETTTRLVARADGDSNHNAAALIIPINGVHKKPHSYVLDEITVPAGCYYTGEKILRCKACGTKKTVVLPIVDHKYRKVEEGTYECIYCGRVERQPPVGSIVKTQLKNAAIKLKRTTLTYNGKAQKPSVTVLVNGTVVPSKYYTVTYNNNIKPGKATVQITARRGNTNPYTGSKKITFLICPQKSAITSVKARKGLITVQWKKSSSGKGYQVQYSTDKNFKKTVGTVRIGKIKTAKTIIRKVKKGVRYYVRVRTVSDKAVSAWSAVKTVKSA